MAEQMALFATPTEGKLFTDEEPDGVRVLIVGIVRSRSDEPRVLFVDEDGYINNVARSHIEFTEYALRLTEKR